MKNSIKNKEELLIALLYAGELRPAKIEGITRLEKLLFILKMEKGILKDVSHENTFNFFPFRMGPWTNEVYDEIDFLESLGLLSKNKEKKDTPSDTASIDELFTNTLLDKYQNSENIPNEKGTEIFSLTVEGEEKAKKIWEKLADEEKKNIQEIKLKFNKMDLKKFLRYVYAKYPEYATESEIKDSLGL
jgi:hypothetical protein